LDDKTAAEAAEWFVEFRSGDDDELMRRRFSQWLTQSPEHVHAYLQTAAVWTGGASLDPRRRFGEPELIAMARAEDIALPWGPGHAPAPVQAQAPQGAQNSLMRRAGTRAAIGIAASLVILVLMSITAFLPRRATYATETGEQRSIALDDGSTVELNSRSRVHVHFTPAERSVDLLEGQALFRVAKDKKRPFVVRSGEASIRAVGTEFDVYQKRQDTVITVIEGRVAVGTAGSGVIGGDAFLGAGEQLTVVPRSNTLRAPVRANLAAATAWTQHRLVFDSASLQEVAEEMNRYNTRPLVIDGAGLDDFHISGVFSSTDPASLLRFLSARADISVKEMGDGIHVSRRVEN
jgi:transmembrane sensor